MGTSIEYPCGSSVVNWGAPVLGESIPLRSEAEKDEHVRTCTRAMASHACTSDGLVISRTSHAGGGFQSGLVELDADKARVSRMQCGVALTARLLAERFQGQTFGVWMVTLTYGDADGHRSRHVSGFCNRLRDWARRKRVPLAYVWVAELQQRGVIHYHVLVWLPRLVMLPKPDVVGWWPHGMTQRERARNPVGYLVKYSSKLTSKGGEFGELYPGSRMYGNGGLTTPERVIRCWYMAPAWVREGRDEVERLTRAVGGGWLLPETGEVLKSPWELVGRSPDWKRLTFRRRGIS